MLNTEKILASKPLYSMLAVSMLYFLIKGIQYAFIGSYVPLIFILVISVLLVWGYAKSVKVHRRTVRFWAILLLLWATVRIGLGIFLMFDNKIPESHLREQFGIIPNIISILLLVIGIQIFLKTKKQS